MTTPVVLDPITFLLMAIYGPEKTAKSTIGLSAPRPMVNFDFDQSYDRAASKFLQKNPGVQVKRVMPGASITDTDLAACDLLVRQYEMPLKFPGKPREGFIALWEGQFMPEFLRVIAAPHIKSIMVDTGTIMWLVDHQAHLERVQRTTSEKTRESLMQWEYGRPNTEARALLAGTRNARKNLISVHHVGTRFGTGIVEERRNGKIEEVIKHDIPIGEMPAGFSQTSSIVDVVVRTRVEVSCGKPECGTFENTFIEQQKHRSHVINPKLIPTGTIETSGYALEAQGLKIQNPDFTAILGLVNAMRVLIP